ncbi:hypothetical protein COTS27_01261 [Spirochaetota bacterium]|nr:hypothetical protein COTS27_01261 [Spirochaetota bacterium]
MIKLMIQIVLFVFIVLALFYTATKMGYIEVTTEGKVALKTVLDDMVGGVKTFIADIFRNIADKIQN